jgi:hypothetical protein
MTIRDELAERRNWEQAAAFFLEDALTRMADGDRDVAAYLLERLRQIGRHDPQQTKSEE